MAITTARFLQSGDGLITIEVDHEETEPQRLEEYRLVNNSTDRQVTVEIFRDHNGTVWRTATFGPGESFVDARPYPQGVKNLSDIPQIAVSIEAI